MKKWRRGERACKIKESDSLINKLEWRDIPDYPGYQASRCGNIRSLPKKLIRSNGRPHKTTDRVLKSTKDTHGYFQVGLYKNKKRSTKQVHRLVYSTFKGFIPDDFHIDHIDSNQENNNIDNLQAINPLDHAEVSNERYLQREYERGFQAGFEACHAYARLQSNIKDLESSLLRVVGQI